ncbi:MAG: hypothetical protein HY017_33525 [Betaproteobacteria bacterium]|nr:hypothetical protein [Betaproteobacteria bacterium]
MTKDKLQDIKQALLGVSKEERRNLLQHLRKEFPIHALEKEWNAGAELILEAITRAPDLTSLHSRWLVAVET